MHPEIKRRVDGFVTDLLAGRASRDVLAVVVSGSAAREEERWTGGELESDIDTMVISRSSALRLDRSRAIQKALAAHADANLEGGRIPVTTLSYATLANYEARQRGVVAYGDPSVLTRIPLAKSSDIPAWEASRLLANRLFEHLKHRAGMASANNVVIKSYEAIGEAQLVLEGRYQPSFRERVTEMRKRPLDSPVSDAQALYIAAEAIRRGEDQQLDVTPPKALADLELQLGAALGALRQDSDTLDGQLAALARHELHFKQRAYWTVRGLGRRDGRHRPTADPILQLWRAAIAALSADTSAYDSRLLVDLWQQCPQILKKGELP